jgi:GWxTD domain-containing protein
MIYMMSARRVSILFSGCILILLAAFAFPEEKLTPAQKTWLEDVAPIITPTERDVFLKLPTEGEREKFIRFFWRQRDPLPDTRENEFYKEYMGRVRFADQYFGIGSFKRGSQTERGYFYLALGKPLERNIFATFSDLWPLELWFYKGEEQYGLPPYFYLIFYQPEGLGDYRLYYPGIEGPEKLIVPNVSTQALTRAAAYAAIKKDNPELASASLSYMPSDQPFGSESFSSDTIIGSIKSLPEKKYNDAYARAYMNYKDHVETEYADNFIGAASKVRLFRVSGQPFVHWSIEPDKMSFAQRGDVFYASFELVIRMEDPKGRLILEKSEEIPVQLTAEQYKTHERRRFAFQDVLPIIDGEYRFFFLLKNKTSREFTSFATTVGVHPQENGAGLSSLLLFHSRESLPPAQKTNTKAFTFDGVQYVISAKNEFVPQESLGAYVQPGRLKAAADDPGAEIDLVISALDGGAVVREQKVPLASTSARNGEGIEFGPFPLAEIKPGYYKAEASLVSRGKVLATERDNFILLGQAAPMLPWAYARVYPPFPSPEHLRILGSQSFLAGDYGRAADSFIGALRTKDDPRTRLLLGKCYFAQGRFRESLAESLPVYESTKDREAAKIIALDHAGLKDWASALVYLEKLMTDATELSVLNLAAECYLNLNQPDKAMPLILKSLSLDSSQPQVKEMEGRAKKALGRA